MTFAPCTPRRMGWGWALAWPLLMAACTGVPTTPACDPDRLTGAWSAHIDGQVNGWRLTLGPHPEHLGSLRGELTQGQLRYPVVADLDEGEFTLEESHDGQRIAATWLGQLGAADCGRRIVGRRLAGEGASQVFTLTRQP